jgi:hypothetical protein
MQLGLVFTNDWELYGDGTGDYFEIQHHPLKCLAKDMESHGAKLTVMAEIGQQWAHKDAEEKFSWAGEIASAWESSLTDMISLGNDVQLHLHPQWLGAKFIGTRWDLNLNKWALPKLSSDEIDRAILAGKEHLEKLFSKVNPDYKCLAFRSGGYCVQPSSKIFSALTKNGFVCDTSVTKGMVQEGLLDFRQAFSNFLPWLVDPDFIEKKADNASDLMEIPILSVPLWDSPIMRWKFGYFYGTRISTIERKWFDENNRVCNIRYPKKNRPYQRSFKPVLLAQALLRKTHVQLDYDHLSAEVFARMVSQVLEQCRSQKLDTANVIIPIIASGHTKNMHNTDNIERILDRLNPFFKEGTVIYWTLTEAVKYWFERLKRNPGYVYTDQNAIIRTKGWTWKTKLSKKCESNIF